MPSGLNPWHKWKITRERKSRTWLKDIPWKWRQIKFAVKRSLGWLSCEHRVKNNNKADWPLVFAFVCFVSVSLWKGLPWWLRERVVKNGKLVKNSPAMWETWVWSLSWEDLLEKGTATQLQYSGLENSIDCLVHGVIKSWTQLNDFHFTLWERFTRFQILISVGSFPLLQNSKFPLN